MFIPEIEKVSKEEIIKYQESRLPDLMAYLNDNSPFYSKVFRENGIAWSEDKKWVDNEKWYPL